MPIIVRQFPDPTSDFWVPGDAPQARSEPLEILRSSLERYLRGEISGRSILISGHRGAGKTTLVDYSLRLAQVAGARPLRIPLYGPNLFPLSLEVQAKEAKPDEMKGDQKPKDNPKGTDGSLTDAQRVLMELTVSLYRSLAKEVARSYEDAVSFRFRDHRSARPLELAGRFILDLDDAPGPERLRNFWQMAGAMETGILFPEAKRAFPLTGFSSVPRDQGIRELVAVASAAQAFRVVAGKLDLSESKVETTDTTNTNSSEKKIDVKALLTATLGLLSGLFGAAGVYSLGTAATAGGAERIKALGAALAAAVAAITSARTATRTATRKVTTGRDYKFIRDFKLDTLGRELPNLIERVRRAGLAPVFVVDELDKVPDLAANLRGLVQQLKPLVAERTFFCFLTDRKYYEHLRAQSREIAYSPEHTYFTHRLFVSYAPEGLRAYLNAVLLAEEANPAEQRALEIDILALTYLMLYRARMHPFDLNVQLQRLAVEQSAGLRRSGEVRTDAGFRYAITYQLAVEAILRQEEVKARLGQDPYLGQVIYDALYYPADRWDRNARKFDLNLKTLRNHLATRMLLSDLAIGSLTEAESPVAEPDAAPPGDPTVKGKRKGYSPRTDAANLKVERLLSATDIEFIFSRLEEMVGLLAKPEQLLIPRLRSFSIHTDIIAFVPRDSLLIIGGDVCTFKFDAFGRPLEGLDQTRRGQLMRALPYIKAMDKAIKDTTRSLGETLNLGSFSDRFGVLDTSPAWAAVELAVARLDGVDAQKRIEGDDAKNALAVINYSDKLEAHSDNLSLAILCGRGVAHAANVGFAAGLDAITKLFNLAALEPAAVGNELQRLAKTLLALGQQADGCFPLTPDNMYMWNLEVAARSTISTPSISLGQCRKKRWEEIRQRWEESSVSNNRGVTFENLICTAAATGASRFFGSDLFAATIANWTTMLGLGLEDRDEYDADYVPLWMGLVAATMLHLPAVGADLELVSASSFKKRTQAKLEIQQFQQMKQPVHSKAGHSLNAQITDFVFVAVAAKSSALQWDVGNKVIGLVTSPEMADSIIKACDLLIPPSALVTTRRGILVEGPATNDSSGNSPFLRSSRVFSGVGERRLVWRPDGEVSAAANQPLPIFGTSRIDALNLTDDKPSPVA